MSEFAVTPRSQDFSAWYNEIVVKAELVDNPERTPVRGCMTLKPYGYELWEAVKAYLDRRFKETGHQNAYFPLFIPMSYFEKEKEHVEGFAPELAVVTYGGGDELTEPYAVRPTSEMIIGEAMSRWIQSYRDLPLLLNQWANVVRWEKRTRPFLRTAEFLWQEGHTAHATYAEAEEETLRMLGVYEEFATQGAAMPVIKGQKSNQEKFAGAHHSYTIEGMMGDGRALQAGTSHNLGQNFAKALGIQYTDVNNELQYCWTTSWGVSWRIVGGIVMTHGDDKGLRLPPAVAPIQLVIVPIFKNDGEKSQVMPVVETLSRQLKAANIRLKVDDRDYLTPGFKYNDWEMRGVPVRMEVGPKDVEKGTVALARRDMAGKEGKQFVSQDNIAATVQQLLQSIQHGLYEQAKAFRDSNLHEVVGDYRRAGEIIQNGGWVLTWFSGEADAEAKMKAEFQAVSRCFPVEQPYPGMTGPCIVTGKPAERMAYFAKSY